jgi:hypothetical protein
MADRNIGTILLLDNDNLQNRGELAFIKRYQSIPYYLQVSFL